MLLTEDTFFNFARRAYDNPSCKTAEEFTSDIRKFGHLKNLGKRFVSGDEINPRLILNNIMILLNVFSRKECIIMMFFKLDADSYPMLKTFLLGIDMMPDEIPELNIKSSDIRVDDTIAQYMRGI